MTSIAILCGTVLFVGRHTSSRTLAIDTPPVDGNSVFARPGIQQRVDRLRLEIAGLFQQNKYDQAALRCSALVKLVPEDPASHYNLGCAQARSDDPEAAMASLGDAVKYGFRTPQVLLDDADLKTLHDRVDWNDLLAAAAVPFERSTTEVTVKPAVISNGVAVVDESNSVWNPRTRRIRTFFRHDRTTATDVQIAVGSDEVSKLLRKWKQEGTAGGHVGVLYDNRDRDHSNLNWKAFPQLTRIEYSKAAKQHNLDNGSQRFIFYNGIVFGNSSTALVGNSLWRSQPRLMYTDSQAAGALAAQYFGNHIYMYPEHRDYDPGTNGKSGFGDVFPANTPYVIISQGSSGTDRVFMNAVAATLAAFRPETRRLLSRKSSLMPCVQMIFRTCNSQVKTDEDYLSGIAHPPVFRGGQVNKLKMARMAHEMLPELLPPVAAVEVVSEDSFEVGRDYFEVGPRESLFTTPAAVARLCRAVSQSRRMTVSAKKSLDLNELKLTWHWVVLQGDPSRVRIEPQDDEQAVVTISLQHHQRQPIRSGSAMQSSRVDIGAFVHNGTYYSAPAIISFYWPENEVRQYSEDGRILSVDYKTKDAGGLYTDPALVTGRNWRDEYLYDDENRLVGWERIRDKQRQTFSRHGHHVTKKDQHDRAIEAANVRYFAEQQGKKPAVLREQQGTVVYTYEYTSDVDRQGTLTETPPYAEHE